MCTSEISHGLSNSKCLTIFKCRDNFSSISNWYFSVYFSGPGYNRTQQPDIKFGCVKFYLCHRQRLLSWSSFLYANILLWLSSFATSSKKRLFAWISLCFVVFVVWSKLKIQNESFVTIISLKCEKLKKEVILFPTVFICPQQRFLCSFERLPAGDPKTKIFPDLN